MADTSAGFKYRYRLDGGEPTIQTLVFKDTETITKGDLVTLETGVADPTVSDDDGILGVALETKAGTTAVSTIKVITDYDAVYGVYDATARAMGTVLDVTGLTGAMTLAADVHHDVIVVAPSAATEETLVVIVHGAHWSNKQKAP